ncbi:type VII secretion integral membrane protein EccD [Actinomadura sp. WAC 06369]|uniref:type VII secretion integral membrane protein EccD n=1 Tax=Actinomadura sp. WAC 06369 TaxID=2203193 RepID=UPI000F7AFDA9|nr:type VII secretion integral membrane protein EccD [Actinomadura sp. WAC 06369]RSN43875.1 type VII secretion integral membrane protein EccD [Actinomadura sp. WAC 06369]
MSAWSRVTLVGEHRRVDMVLPAREPIGALLPDVLEVLDDPVQSPPRLRHLATSTGEVLDPGTTLAERRIPDGAVLRLVRGDEPLPAPVVHEVPEVVGDALDGRLWRWGPAAMRWTATAAVAALAAAIVLVLRAGVAGPAAASAGAAAGVLLLVCGTVAAPAGREPLGTALVLGGGAAGAVALWTAAERLDRPDWLAWTGAGLLAAALTVLLGAVSPLGRGGVVGGAVIALLAGAGGLCAAFGLDAPRIGAVLAGGCVVLLGVVLRLALALSGLTSLDDRRGEGGAVRRGDVLEAFDGAHRTMTIATAAVAVAAAVAGFGALSRFDGWTAALAGLLAVVLGGRARVFPLVVQKAALLGAAVAITVGLAVRLAGHASWGPPAALVLLAGVLAVPVAVLAAGQPEHVRARLRRAANVVEGLAVVAIVPVAIGVFGTFERLLGTF